MKKVKSAGGRTQSLDKYTANDWLEAQRPITSLISKSEKAQHKLAPGMWQYAMLRNNLKALRCAFVLMNEGTNDANKFTPDDLREALRAVSSIISKVKKSQAKFSRGTSQHSLQRNRLKALRIASLVITKSLDHQQKESRRSKTSA